MFVMLRGSLVVLLLRILMSTGSGIGRMSAGHTVSHDKFLEASIYRAYHRLALDGS